MYTHTALATALATTLAASPHTTLRDITSALKSHHVIASAAHKSLSESATLTSSSETPITIDIALHRDAHGYISASSWTVYRGDNTAYSDHRESDTAETVIADIITAIMSHIPSAQATHFVPQPGDKFTYQAHGTVRSDAVELVRYIPGRDAWMVRDTIFSTTSYISPDSFMTALPA